MLSVKVICVGKLGEKFWKQAVQEYEKRLSSFCKLEVLELPEFSLPQSPSRGEISSALEKETKAICAKIPAGAFTCVLCIEGTPYASEEFANKLKDIMTQGISKVCFIIGGSFGLSESLKSSAQLRLSMSLMTFPHHFARVMLLEQLYRAFHIIQGGKYHK